MSISIETPNIQNLVDEAWGLRFLHKNDEVEILLRDIDHLLKSTTGSEVLWQSELLHISLLRSRGDLHSSNRRLEALKTQIDAVTARPPFQFFFQKAINLIADDEYSTALEFFLIADSVSPNSDFRTVCLMNILICLENLNLPAKQTLSDLEIHLQNLKIENLRHAIVRQLTVFYQRIAFRNGDFKTLFDLSLEEDMDQSKFYRLWVARLPYVLTKPKGDEIHLRSLALSKNFHAKNFRLKTVLADQRISEDGGADTAVETPQKVDRIYLWTWNWLANPCEKNRQNLAACLKDFDFKTAPKKMTFEDFQMLRNALSWIAMYQEDMALWISRYLENFSLQDCESFPIFDFEFLYIDAVQKMLRGESSAKAALAKYKSHPLHKVSDLRFEEIISCKKPTTKKHDASIVVDELTAQIQTKSETLISKPVARVLISLAERHTLSFAEALWLGFEISPYDQEIHAPKIYNLIARIKKILPKGISIKTKNQRIYWIGKPDQVIRLGKSPLEIRLFENVAEFTNKLSPKSHRTFSKTLHPRAVVEKANGKRRLCRDELQEIMGISKASTVRWIEKWTTHGLISREGNGRSSIYNIEIIGNHRLSGLA